MNCATHRKTTINSRRSACVSYVWPRVAQSARRLKNLEPLNIAPSPDRTSQETGHGWLLVGGGGGLGRLGVTALAHLPSSYSQSHRPGHRQPQTLPGPSTQGQMILHGIRPPAHLPLRLRCNHMSSLSKAGPTVMLPPVFKREWKVPEQNQLSYYNNPTEQLCAFQK